MNGGNGGDATGGAVYARGALKAAGSLLFEACSATAGNGAAGGTVTAGQAGNGGNGGNARAALCADGVNVTLSSLAGTTVDSTRVTGGRGGSGGYYDYYSYSGDFGNGGAAGLASGAGLDFTGGSTVTIKNLLVERAAAVAGNGAGRGVKRWRHCQRGRAVHRQRHTSPECGQFSV